jgi:hypothetical protein
MPSTKPDIQIVADADTLYQAAAAREDWVTPQWRARQPGRRRQDK